MILGSHNSWSYLPVRKWWMKPIVFMARCQSVDIRTQYEKYGVRCFDLRVRFNEYGKIPADVFVVAHGIIEYNISYYSLIDDLVWLNEKGDCYVRVLHEVRSGNEYSALYDGNFKFFCNAIEHSFKNIRFWCGRNLYDWGVDYDFEGEDPSCEEKYASVCPPKLIDDWWPWLYARLHNRKNLREGSEGILLIDFVNIK